MSHQWPSTTITWSLAQQTYSNDSPVPNDPNSGSPFEAQPNPSSQWDDVIARAFSAWASATGINFQEVPDAASIADAADIRVGFADPSTLVDPNDPSKVTVGVVDSKWTSSSDPNSPFSPDSLIRFRDSSDTSLTPINNGSDFLFSNTNVTLYDLAMHEIGLALGLGSSDGDPNSVMNDSLSNSTPDAADIAAIQSLYPTATPSQPAPSGNSGSSSSSGSAPSGSSPSGSGSSSDPSSGTPANPSSGGSQSAPNPSSGSAPQGGIVLETDTTTGVSSTQYADPYSGPYTELQWQFFSLNSDNVVLWAQSPNTYLVGGSGDDALTATSGTNVLDGRGGSNFLVGGTRTDTFFLDPRNQGTTWDTIVNFHGSEMVTIWGYQAGVSKYTIEADKGAAGYTGATLRIDLNGTGDFNHTSLTFAGHSVDDVSHFTLSTGEASGQPYLMIHA